MQTEFYCLGAVHSYCGLRFFLQKGEFTGEMIHCLPQEA